MLHRFSRHAAGVCATLTLAGCVQPGVTHRSGRFEAGTLVGGDPDRKAVLLQHTDGTLTWLPLTELSRVDHAGASLWRGGLATTIAGTSLALLVGLLAPPGDGIEEQWRVGGLLGGAMLAAAGGMLVGFGANQEAVSQAHQRRAMVPPRWSVVGAGVESQADAAPAGGGRTAAAAVGTADETVNGQDANSAGAHEALRKEGSAPVSPASSPPRGTP